MLLAGFDAGQTTTRCRIVELVGDQWHEIATGLGPGVSHLEAANGTERFQAAIRTSRQTGIRSHRRMKGDRGDVGLLCRASQS